MDTICCSIMTLSTIAMGGLFAFLRIPLTAFYPVIIWRVDVADITMVGTIAALALYATGIWRGIRVPAESQCDW